MKYNIADLKLLIEKSIASFVPGSHPKELYQPITYLLNLGGKRIRPLLTLLAYQLFRDNVESIVRPALAVEVFHNFTLVHDDIIDEAPLRRGHSTVHKKWNTNTAILAGDVMMIKALTLLDGLESDKFSTIIEEFCSCAIQVCEGQQLDMNFETHDHITEEDYLQMIRLKTAVLLGFSLKFGAQLGGADPHTTQLLYDVGVNLGISFQLKDDLLDVYAQEAKLGKQIGRDISTNKKTYLRIKAFELADTQQKKILTHWLQKSPANHEEKVYAVKAIFDQLDIQTHTEKKAQAYCKQALTLIEKIEAKPTPKDLLKTFANELFYREN
ncbi:MAG: polyprenyl synthetase family protein [Cytophagales bacterium]|nr:polyprenyl synthetase family protein [Cytophagales bacterium]